MVGDILATSSMNDLQSHLSLREPTYFILLALAPGPRHGYAIMKRRAAISDGRVRLSTSTLYGAIKRLLELDWIARSEADSGIEDGRMRKVYRLTDLGRYALKAETARMHALVTMVRHSEEGVTQ